MQALNSKVVGILLVGKALADMVFMVTHPEAF
jgi:hypothetical protein